jgi:hypothetical protein
MDRQRDTLAVMARGGVIAEIESLDPTKDYQRICYLSTNHDFPWDVEQSLSLAFFKTYGVPTISALLDMTGEFRDHAQKRYDDTKLILAEMLDHGIDSDRGREANRRLNHMHGRYKISNDDYLYVWSVILLEPIRWNRRWGWRRYTQKELDAQLVYARELARRMNIRDVPATIADVERWSRAYEAANFRFAETNRRVADYTLNLYLSWYPRAIRTLVRIATLALLDPELIGAFGYERPSRWVVASADAALRTRAFVLRFFPRRRAPRLVTQERMRSYPSGYTLADVGVADLDLR